MHLTMSRAFQVYLISERERLLSLTASDSKYACRWLALFLSGQITPQWVHVRFSSHSFKTCVRISSASTQILGYFIGTADGKIAILRKPESEASNMYWALGSMSLGRTLGLGNVWDSHALYVKNRVIHKMPSLFAHTIMASRTSCGTPLMAVI